MSVYDYTDLPILGIVAKKIGQTIQAAITFSNTGDVDWTYGIGFSIKDSAGTVWNCWSGNIIKTIVGNEGNIDSHFCARNAIITHAVANIPVPSTMALGTIQFGASIFKTSTGPIPSDEISLAGTGWRTTDNAGNNISIESSKQYTVGLYNMTYPDGGIIQTFINVNMPFYVNIKVTNTGSVNVHIVDCWVNFSHFRTGVTIQFGVSPWNFILAPGASSIIQSTCTLDITGGWQLNMFAKDETGMTVSGATGVEVS